MNPFDTVAISTFGALVRDHAAARPDAAALSFADRRWTYAALDLHANRIAHALLRDGIVAGDRIAWLGRNSDVVALLALACARAGAIFVPINWRLAPLEIAHILADCGARALVLGDGYRTPAGAPPIATLDARTLVDGAWLDARMIAPDVAVDARDTVLMMYTSGTTGLPKGVMLSHRSLFGTSTLRRRTAVPWDDWSADDVTLVPVPLAHIGGFGMLARTLFFGGEAVVQEGFDPGDVLDAIAHRRISKVGLVPTAMKMVIDHPRSREVDYRRIRTMIYGAAPITLDLLREAIEVFGCRFAQSYGMSETSGTCVALPPDDHDVAGNPRMRSAGRALPGTELKIVDAAGVAVPDGTDGEIAIRCISVMNGYWNRPDATAQVLDADGWYRTGDAGCLDADGYLFIKDRLKDMIVSGAENIYPAEVENALADHPDVAQVAVIGVPDAHWGEAVKAVVVPAPGRSIDAPALIAWARTRIAAFKAPRSIDIVAALPHNASGKVQKAELRKRYWAGSERGVN
ncbi:hypothetical protein ASG29_04155 [Sphingomonas sp. Leaf412]|uniref:AMP-binding protein n=1 Tax=Sphingomonas sp. Leaf412 TaxID=1736370 RepID=UPI0006FA7951|nr:AMP-binding protein [Sphingomonas sp. Leaf412]KQT35299.1 hypothetical protein ASG29_04155 [Sphingomonas sp. Leaf412]